MARPGRLLAQQPGLVTPSLPKTGTIVLPPQPKAVLVKPKS